MDAEPVAEPASEPSIELKTDKDEPAPRSDPDVLQKAEQEIRQHPDAWPPEDSRVIQHVITESCDTRPLTPISRCFTVGLPGEHQTSEAGLFAEDLFPYNTHHYKEVLLAHARL